MAKGNTGQGQYKPSARKALTNAPSAQVRTPSTGNDFLGGIGDIGSLLGSADKNNTSIGGFGNTGFAGGNPWGQLLMGSNPWNQGMTGGNPFSSFNPWSMFGGNPTNFNPPKPAAPAAPTPTAPKTYNANEASQKLREGLTQNLTNDEIGQLLGAMGKKTTDTFTDEDIARARTLVGQNRPNYINPAPSTPNTPAPPNQIDTGGRGIPNPTPQAATPTPNLNDMSTQLRSRLTRDLSGDEIGMLMGALGGNLNVDAATNLIRQYKPELLK